MHRKVVPMSGTDGQTDRQTRPKHYPSFSRGIIKIKYAERTIFSSSDFVFSRKTESFEMKHTVSATLYSYMFVINITGQFINRMVSTLAYTVKIWNLVLHIFNVKHRLKLHLFTMRPIGAQANCQSSR